MENYQGNRCRSTPKAENEAITFDGSQVTSPKQIANYFNQQFTTSMLGRHTSSRDTRLVYREIKQKYLTSAMAFTTDQVTKGISSCRNTRAFGPNKLSIFHLKYLGSRGIEYLTALFNDSVTSCRIPSFWKSSIVIPISKPDKDCSLSTSYRPLSLLCPVVKVMEALLLPTINSHLLPSADQHGFRPGHSTNSALLQLTSGIATGFNQRKPPHRTVCVAVDLMAAFDTVNHNILLSKFVRSTLPEATCRSMAVKLLKRQTISYLLQRWQVKGKDSPCKRNNVLKALANTNWGQQKETLLLTYKALGRSIANYAAPVCSTNASDTSL